MRIMKKKYIAPTVEKIDLTYFEAVAHADSHGLVNTSTGGVDSGDVLSNKREATSRAPATASGTAGNDSPKGIMLMPPNTDIQNATCPIRYVAFVLWHYTTIVVP